MEAKDLMIGDKLKTIFSQKVVKVKEIKQNCIYTEDNGYEYDEIEPILLTSNILEKNGWIYNNEDEKFFPQTWVGGGMTVIYLMCLEYFVIWHYIQMTLLKCSTKMVKTILVSYRR